MTASLASAVLLLMLYASMNTAAMASIKVCSPRFTRREHGKGLLFLLSGGVLYAVGIGALLLLLRIGEATVMFPLAIASTVVVSNVADSLFFHQPFTKAKLFGTLLLLSGISVTYATGSGT